MLSPTSGSYFHLTKHAITPTTTIDEIHRRIEKATGKKLESGYPYPDLVPGRGDIFAYLPFQKTIGLIEKTKNAFGRLTSIVKK